MTITEVWEKWHQTNTVHHLVPGFPYGNLQLSLASDCWQAIRAHIEARCVWTYAGNGHDTSCGEWHDGSVPWANFCQYCGRMLECKEESNE